MSLKDNLYYPEIEAKLSNRMGTRLTTGLFHETELDKSKVVYTLRDEAYNGLPSAKAIYMEIADPTEYAAALAIVGSWNHWLRLLGNKLLLKHIEDWRVELEIKMRSEALLSVAKQSVEKTASGLTAAKYIAEQGWLKGGKGRPSKEDVKAEIKKAARIKTQFDSDYNRLGLDKEVN